VLNIVLPASFRSWSGSCYPTAPGKLISGVMRCRALATNALIGSGMFSATVQSCVAMLEGESLWYKLRRECQLDFGHESRFEASLRHSVIMA